MTLFEIAKIALPSLIIGAGICYLLMLDNEPIDSSDEDTDEDQSGYF